MVLVGTEDRELRQVGGGQQRGPFNLSWAVAPLAGGFLLQIVIHFIVQGLGQGPLGFSIILAQKRQQFGPWIHILPRP